MMMKKYSTDLISSLERKFKVLESLLSPLKFKERRLRKNIQKLKVAAKAAITWAPNYDYNGIEANGYWSFARLIEKFLQLCVDSFCKHNHRNYDPKLDLISSGLVKYIGVMELMRKSSQSDENSNIGDRLKLNISGFDTTMIFIRHFTEMKKEQTALHAYYPNFWLCSSNQKSISGFAFLMALFSSLPMSLKSIWNRQYRGLMVTECQMRATRNYPFALWNLTDLELYKFAIRMLTRNRDKRIVTTTVLADRQNVFKLPTDGLRVQINHHRSVSNSKVRCRLLRDETRENPTKSIVLHCHGGAMMAQTPDSHEVEIPLYYCNCNCAVITYYDTTFLILLLTLHLFVSVSLALSSETGIST